MSYRYCAICKMQHDPEKTPCFDATQQILKDAGIPAKKPRMDKKERRKLKILEHNANMVLIKIVLVIIISMILLRVIASWIETGW